jgi:anti-sigma factor RsiW
MPEVALQRARWTPEEERHLAGCPECQAEWAIVAAGSRLGARLPAVDAERVAARALERIRRERANTSPRTRRMAALAGLAAAAVVALAVWADRGGPAGKPGGSTLPAPAPMAASPSQPVPNQPAESTAPALARGSAAATVDLSIPELDSLPAEALDMILRTLDEPLAQVGADDLQPDESGDRELEQVLAGMEG